MVIDSIVSEIAFMIRYYDPLTLLILGSILFFIFYKVWKMRHQVMRDAKKVVDRWLFWVVYLIALLGILGPLLYLDSPDVGPIAEHLQGFAVYGIPIGLYLFFDSFSTFRRYQRIATIPTSSVRSMAMGLVELEGKVVTEETIKAPFSGTECVFYTYHIEEGLPDEKGKNWVYKHSGRNSCSFYLDDGTGQVLVDPQGADLQLQTERTVHVDGMEDPPDYIRKFMEKNDIDSSIHDMRFTETYLKPGNEVYVYGEAMERSGAASSRNEENIVVSDNSHTPLFLISDTSEEEIKERMSSTVYFTLFGGAALTVLSIGILLYYGLVM